MPTDSLADLPKGLILPWFITTLPVLPKGWAICDGTNNTPDLRNVYLVGTNSHAEVGQTIGATSHNHSYSGNTNSAGGNPDGWHFDDPERGKQPQATGYDHTHGFNGSTSSASNYPPSVKIIFIMKIK